MIKVSTLKKNPNNPRQIRGEKLDLLKKSVTEFEKMMSLRPIIVDENNVVLGGNMRLAAIKALGHKEIPDEWVKRADDLTEDEKARFIISDNSAFGEYDWDVIANEWSDLPLADWGLDVPGFEAQTSAATPWRAEDEDEFYANESDGIELKAGYRLGSIWYGMTAHNEVRPYMLELPLKEGVHDGATVKLKYSRTNAGTTERIVKTYMRDGDIFFEQCCGWMTFSGTAKYFGFSGKGGDIWDTSLEFCERQLKAMPGEGNVEVIRADCRDTGEPSSHYDFVHSNPPFFNLEPYGDDPNDLASTGSYERWLDAMGEMAREAERILKPGGIANFVINDMREKGEVVLMHADFVRSILNKSTLKLHDFVIAEVISQALRFRKHDYERRRTVKCHEYIITFKKNG